MAPRLIAIVGPTASGKSGVALRLASERAAEIVCCDSLQVYRGLDIGSAKPTAEERQRVPHHLLDVIPPDGSFSAADYSRLARAAIADVAGRGRLPLVVGGSGLYFRALFQGLFEGPARDAAFRRRAEALAERRGDERLHALLRRRDPQAAARIPARDRVRVVRALEVLRATGRPIGEHHQAGASPLRGYSTFVAGLRPERGWLQERVERRSREMLEGGLLREVRGLLDTGYAAGLKPLGAIGYRQALACLDGKLDPQACLAAIVAATMRYAKRQMTWFRREAAVRWFAGPDAALAALRAWLAEPEA